MSATRNENDVNALSGQEGEVGSKVPRSEPLTTTGHQVGKIVSPEDAAPTFEAETYPPGTAPAANTFKPNPQGEDPPSSNYNTKGNDPESTTADAQDTITGASSADVDMGIGKPVQGQSSKELHDNSGQRSGLEGTGAAGDTRLAGDRVPGMSRDEGKGVDPSAPAQAHNRGLNKETTENDHKGQSDAQDREPETATTVASESKS